jgi:hypothetical protein
MSSVGAESVPPFEFWALEVALEAICSFLDAKTKELESTGHPALDGLTKKAFKNFPSTYLSGSAIVVVPDQVFHCNTLVVAVH